MRTFEHTPEKCRVYNGLRLHLKCIECSKKKQNIYSFGEILILEHEEEEREAEKEEREAEKEERESEKDKEEKNELIRNLIPIPKEVLIQLIERIKDLEYEVNNSLHTKCGHWQYLLGDYLKYLRGDK